jgi:hypothetical protein
MYNSHQKESKPSIGYNELSSLYPTLPLPSSHPTTPLHTPLPHAHTPLLNPNINPNLNPKPNLNLIPNPKSHHHHSRTYLVLGLNIYNVVLS